MRSFKILVEILVVTIILSLLPLYASIFSLGVNWFCNGTAGRDLCKGIIRVRLGVRICF